MPEQTELTKDAAPDRPTQESESQRLAEEKLRQEFRDLRRPYKTTLRLIALIVLMACPSVNGTQDLAIERGATGCTVTPPSTDLSRFDVVFSGELESDGDADNLSFRTQRVWKGPIQAEFSVGNDPSGPPSRIVFHKGTTYLVYARAAAESRLSIAPCSRTNDIQNASDDLAVLGEGTDAAHLLALAKTWNSSGQVTIRERVYGGPDESTDRVFHFPSQNKVSLQASGPKGFRIAIFGYLSLDAQNLDNVKRIGPRDRRITIELSDQQRATFTTADPIDAPYTELDVEFIFALTRGEEFLSPDKEPGTGVLSTLSDSGDHLTAAAIRGLPRGFTIKLDWTDAPPARILTHSWEDDLAQIDKHLQADLMPDPNCDEPEIRPQHLTLLAGTLILDAEMCAPLEKLRAEFPVSGLNAAKVKATVYLHTPPLSYVSSSQQIFVSIPCNNGKCGKVHRHSDATQLGNITLPATDTDEPADSLHIRTTFRAGLARELQVLLTDLITRVQSSQKP